ncbi:unnamed protein product [Arabidopsis halleri]
MFSFRHLYLFLLAIIMFQPKCETYSKGVAFKSSSLSLSLSLSESADIISTYHLLLHQKILNNTPKTKTHLPKTETNKKISIDRSFSGSQIRNSETMYPTSPHHWRKRLLINAQALLLLILCLFFIHHCEASRFSSSSVFYRNPNYDHNNNSMRRGHFLGFLPRHLPVPASAPSRKHNDVGIQALLSP